MTTTISSDHISHIQFTIGNVKLIRVVARIKFITEDTMETALLLICKYCLQCYNDKLQTQSEGTRMLN